MRKVYVNESKTVEIGYNGENAAVALCFPFVELWHSLYGEDGTFSVVLKKPRRDEPYIKETFEDEKDAYCVIEEADVTDIGYGYAVLIYSVGENVVARSKAYAISVDRSLLAGEDPVEPYQAYIDSILEAASDAINARTGAETAKASALQHAQDAETSATNASTSAENASTAATSASTSALNAEASAKRAEEAAETFTIPIASQDKAGAVILNSYYGVYGAATGTFFTGTRSASQYKSAPDAMFVGKGTLDNVLASRNVTLTQAEYDALTTKDLLATYYIIEEE